MKKILSKNLISIFNILFLIKKNKYNKSKINKILFISIGNSGIGDILMLFPTIYLLKKKFKNAQIDFLFPNYASFLFEFEKTSNYYFKDDNFKKTLKTLKNKNYDLIISNHWLSSYYSNLISFSALKIGFFFDFGFNDNYGTRISSNFKINNFSQIIDDRIGKFLLLLYSFNLISKKELFNYRNDYSLISEFSESIINPILKKPKSFKLVNKKINIVLYFKENFKINNFGLKKDFLDKLYLKLNNNYENLNFYIIGPNYDSKKMTFKKENIFNFKKISWDETLFIIDNADIIICDDSSIMHFSLILLKKTISIFNIHISPFLRIPNNNLKDSIFINNFFIHDNMRVPDIKNSTFIYYDNYILNQIQIKLNLLLDKFYK